MKAPSRKSAPSVVFPVKRSAFLARVIGSILVVAAGAIVAWAVSSEMAASRPWGWWCASVGAWVLAALGAGHFWFHQLQGELRWDGSGWLLSVGEPGRTDSRSGALKEPPEPLIDLQTHLWLVLSAADGRRVWLWLERAHHPQRWLDLRRAVYSRAPSGTGPADNLTRPAAVDRDS